MKAGAKPVVVGLLGMVLGAGLMWVLKHAEVTGLRAELARRDQAATNPVPHQETSLVKGEDGQMYINYRVTMVPPERPSTN